jgi:hypothetical protein
MDVPTVPHLAQVVFDSTDPRASAEFWRQFLALSYRPGHEAPDMGAEDPNWLNLFTPAGVACLAFQRVDELPVSTWPDPGIPQQLHLDLTVASVDDLMSAHARIIELGGSLLYDRSDSPEEPLQVFSDLDGHPFCVFVAT